MKPRLLVAGFAALTLWGADTASAFVSANTIDGPARVTVTQSATGAQARKTWTGRCTGEMQHWQVRARARPGAPFEIGAGRVCAVARTRTAGRVTDTGNWCERVAVSARF